MKKIMVVLMLCLLTLPVFCIAVPRTLTTREVEVGTPDGGKPSPDVVPTENPSVEYENHNGEQGTQISAQDSVATEMPSVSLSTTTLFTETFEGAFPGAAWTVGDSETASGQDYWGDINYNAHIGSWSGWCADMGTQPRTEMIWSEGFEGAFPGSWTVGDWNTNNGADYWDDTSYKAHGGLWSGWCAQIGDQSGTANSVLHKYDHYMQAYMYKTLDLSAYSSVTLSYYYWLNCESNADYLQVMVWDQIESVWTYVHTRTGNSGGWQYDSVSVPNWATAKVGFYFYSDSSVNNEGAYVDDIVLSGVREVPNNSCHQYDDNMHAYMYRAVSLGSYGSASISYWYWTNCESGYDYLQVIYCNATGWYYMGGNNKHSGNSGGYRHASASIPTTATYVGFYFHSDGSIHNYEGAYIDDIVCTGTIGQVTVNGKFFYWDDNTASYVAIRNAVVKLCDSDIIGGNDLLASGTTDSAGYYSLGPVTNYDADEGGLLDVMVVVWADGSTVRVLGSTGGTWGYYAGTTYDVPDGTYNMGDWTAPGSDDGAYNVYNVLLSGALYADARPGTPAPPKVQCLWYPGNTHGTHYHHGNATIQLLGGASDPDEWDNGVILHEYGHHIAHWFNADNSPGGTHSWQGKYGLELAWNEGWCHYFACAVRNSPSYRDTVSGGWVEYNHETGILRRSDGTTVNANANGDRCEASVAGVLWDICDSANDDQNGDGKGDTLSAGEDAVWDVIHYYTTGGHGVYTIHEYWNGWFSRGHGSNQQMWAVYYEHGISKPDTIAPSNPTSYWSDHTANVWSNDSTIYAEWYGANDDLSGVRGYSYLWTKTLSLPDAIRDTNTNFCTSSPLANGNWYLCMRTVDWAGNWAPSYVWAGPFKIDTSPPTNPTSYTSSHATGQWSNDSTIFVQWYGASDALSGVKGYSYVWSNSPKLPDTTQDTVNHNCTSSPLANGDWYLCIRTVDVAGNWAPSYVYIGKFRIDTTSPQYSGSSPLGGTKYTNDATPIRLQINWTDGGSGVASASVKFRYKYGSGSWTGWLTPTSSLGNKYWYDILYGQWSTHVGQVVYWESKATDNVANLRQTTTFTGPTIRYRPGVLSFTVTPNPFSPNGDGSKDNTTIGATFNANMKWILQVRTASGTIVRRWTGTGLTLSVIWDGRNSTGYRVPDGTYNISLSGADASGVPFTTKYASVRVDTTRPVVTSVSVYPASFNPKTGQSTRINYTLSESCYIKILIYNSTGALKRTLVNNVLQRSGLHSVAWNGKDNSNVTVPPGTYTIKIYVTDIAGNKAASYPIIKTVTVV